MLYHINIHFVPEKVNEKTFIHSTRMHLWGFPGAQGLRIHLPIQRTRVRALVQEDPTRQGGTKPMLHNYWACALEPESHNYWACALEPESHNYWARVTHLLKPTRLGLVLHNKRSHLNEKPAHCNEEQPPLAETRESPCAATKTQRSQK